MSGHLVSCADHSRQIFCPCPEFIGDTPVCNRGIVGTRTDCTVRGYTHARVLMPIPYPTAVHRTLTLQNSRLYLRAEVRSVFLGFPCKICGVGAPRAGLRCGTDFSSPVQVLGTHGGLELASMTDGIVGVSGRVVAPQLIYTRGSASRTWQGR